MAVEEVEEANEGDEGVGMVEAEGVEGVGTLSTFPRAVVAPFLSSEVRCLGAQRFSCSGFLALHTRVGVVPAECALLH